MKLILNRNLKRQILLGHPWIYRDSLEIPPPKSPANPQKAQLAPLFDRNSKLMAWGIYDSTSPLAFRVLSAGKVKPRREEFLARIEGASKLRRPLWQSDFTTALRLINGEGDQLPGLVIDIYDNTLVIQFDGNGMHDFWEPWLGEIIPKISSEWPHIKKALVKPRSGDTKKPMLWIKKTTPLSWQQDELDSDSGLELIQIFENGMRFWVDCFLGQKTGFFLDQRDHRLYVSLRSRGKKVLNLFSYTGGFSLAAGIGGASSVESMDVSQQALDLAQKNWQLNGLKSPHKTSSEDIFAWVKVNNPNNSHWDSIIVDPPSMTKSERTKAEARDKYIQLFAWTLQQLAKGGDAYFSSCSSHISFSDFIEIIQQACSNSKTQGSILKISGQGPDHPFPAAAEELRYLKFVHFVKG